MKKYILTVLLSFSNVVQAASPLPLSHCVNQAPYGFPTNQHVGPTICRHAYVTQNDIKARLPKWVSYTLTPENAIGCVKRSNRFTPDTSLPKGQRAELADYEHSGYDIGHMAPNGDMSFNQVVENESFILTNMSPQRPSINRGSWKLLETNIRGWAVQRNHSYVIYTGPLYTYTNPTIGPNRVIVPHGFYKIVVDTSTKEVAGWVFPNQGNPGKDLSRLRESVAQISKLSGITFFYPQGATELPAEQSWDIDYKKLTSSKKSECSILQ